MREPMASLMTGTACSAAFLAEDFRMPPSCCPSGELIAVPSAPACFPDQVPEKMVELLLVPDLEQLGGKLHLLAFVEDFLQLAGKFELLGLRIPVFHIGFELGTIDVMHDVPPCFAWVRIADGGCRAAASSFRQ